MVAVGVFVGGGVAVLVGKGGVAVEVRTAVALVVAVNCVVGVAALVFVEPGCGGNVESGVLVRVAMIVVCGVAVLVAWAVAVENGVLVRVAVGTAVLVAVPRGVEEAKGVLVAVRNGVAVAAGVRVLVRTGVWVGVAPAGLLFRRAKPSIILPVATFPVREVEPALGSLPVLNNASRSCVLFS